jgi:hypothetical protein
MSKVLPWVLYLLVLGLGTTAFISQANTSPPFVADRFHDDNAMGAAANALEKMEMNLRSIGRRITSSHAPMMAVFFAVMALLAYAMRARAAQREESEELIDLQKQQLVVLKALRQQPPSYSPAPAAAPQPPAIATRQGQPPRDLPMPADETPEAMARRIAAEDAERFRASAKR